MTQISITKGTQTFTFTEAMVPQISTTLTPDIYKTVMPSGSSMSNVGNDFNGVEKTINLTVTLVPSTSTVVTGSGSPTITTVAQMKYWLESLCDGLQTAMTFTSNYDSYSVESSSGSCVVNGSSGTIEGVAIPARWSTTKVYITGLTFTETTTPEYLDCTITLWVAGI